MVCLRNISIHTLHKGDDDDDDDDNNHQFCHVTLICAVGTAFLNDTTTQAY
jgi:hypothetical protein